MKYLTYSFVLVAFAFQFSGSLQAQHNDIEFGYDSGQIFLETGELTDSSSDAHRIFEGNFPTTGAFERYTDDPGFASEVEEGLGVGANDLIGLDIIQSNNFGSYLTYFDPNTMVISSTGAMITLEKGANSLEVTETSGGLFAVLQADEFGIVHDHIDFYLSDGAEVGAYGLLFEMTSDDGSTANSEPVWLVFNYGMDEEVFDSQALSAFGKLSAVPEPGSTIVFGLAGLALASIRRKRT